MGFYVVGVPFVMIYKNMSRRLYILLLGSFYIYKDCPGVFFCFVRVIWWIGSPVRVWSRPQGSGGTYLLLHIMGTGITKDREIIVGHTRY